jgi:hypothetical protein
VGSTDLPPEIPGSCLAVLEGFPNFTIAVSINSPAIFLKESIGLLSVDFMLLSTVVRSILKSFLSSSVKYKEEPLSPMRLIY